MICSFVLNKYSHWTDRRTDGHNWWNNWVSLINRSTHLCKCNGMADPQNKPLPVCVTTPNLVVLGLQVMGLRDREKFDISSRLDTEHKCEWQTADGWYRVLHSAIKSFCAQRILWLLDSSLQDGEMSYWYRTCDAYETYLMYDWDMCERESIDKSINLNFQCGIRHPPGLPSRTILDRTYSAQRFFIFSYFFFFFLLGRAVD